MWDDTDFLWDDVDWRNTDDADFEHFPAIHDLRLKPEDQNAPLFHGALAYDMLTSLLAKAGLIWMNCYALGLKPKVSEQARLNPPVLLPQKPLRYLKRTENIPLLGVVPAAAVEDVL